MTYNFEQVIRSDAVDSIIRMCNQRDFKCKGCPYSIKKVVANYKGLGCCIFDVCPCNWKTWYEGDIK